jgi:predicted nucleotidyltransferase
MRAMDCSVDTVCSTLASVLREHPDPSVIAVFLYGSVLHARQRPDSDIDVAVLDTADLPLPYSRQAALMDVLERNVGAPVDLRMLRLGSIAYQTHVVTAGRLVHVTDRAALAAYESRLLAEHDRGPATAELQETIRRLATMTE